MNNSTVWKENEVNRYKYCVLYTTVMKQERLLKLLKKRLPEERGVAFAPMMESYRRDGGKTLELKPLFPGYIFIRSDMKAGELHAFIQKYRPEFMSYIKELWLSEKLASGEIGSESRSSRRKQAEIDSSSGETGTDSEPPDPFDMKISDLTDEEARYLDLLLDFDRTGGELAPDVIRYMFDKDEDTGVEAMMPRDDRTADDYDATSIDASTAGLLRMSYGYRDNGKWIVMKGPLRAFQDHIKDVNKHNKKAFLDIKIGGRIVRAGFDVKPKKYWFPEDEKAPEVLDDGSELDIDGLVRSMTTLKSDPKTSRKKKKRWTEARSKG